jgi:hypothetical protein
MRLACAHKIHDLEVPGTQDIPECEGCAIVQQCNVTESFYIQGGTGI